MTHDGPPLGHIKLARKAFSPDHGDPFWLEARTFSRWEAWVDVIQLAAFKPYRYQTVRFGVVDLERGEFVASRRHLAERWRWTEKRVRVFVEQMVKTARVRAQRETKAGTVYLVVNYDTYQNTQRSEGPAKGPVKGHAGAQQGPKREAVKAITTTTFGAEAPAAGVSWVARLADYWNAEVGRLTPGRIGADAKPFVDKHGVERVERAMRCYVAFTKAQGKPVKWAWFVEEGESWIQRTAGALDVVDGEMTDTLELLTRPGRVA